MIGRKYIFSLITLSKCKTTDRKQTQKQCFVLILLLLSSLAAPNRNTQVLWQ